MLERSFIHAQGVGPTTERTLWGSGAHDWDAFLRLYQAKQLRGGRMHRIAEVVEESGRALRGGEIEYFGSRLPAGELWRLHAHFGPRAAYFDIETTGLSPGLDSVTVIGLYDGERFEVFVQGRNLHEFPRAAARYPLLVSFNGATFDVPFLQHHFPGFAPRAHLDLRYPLARLGYRGGLKQIEREVGIARPGHLAQMDGFDAVILWRRYLRGDRAALERLIQYTREDVVNLAALAALVSREMPGLIGLPGARA